MLNWHTGLVLTTDNEEETGLTPENELAGANQSKNKLIVAMQTGV